MIRRRYGRLIKIGLILFPILLFTTLALSQSSASSIEAAIAAGLPMHDHGVTLARQYGAGPATNRFIGPVITSPLLQSADTVGQWSSVSNWPLIAIHAALMPDGQIIMWDRENQVTTSMRYFNPSNSTFTSLANPSPDSVFCAGFTLLTDGRLLLSGGHLVGDNYGLNHTNMFDLATGSWSRSGDMTYARWYPTVITLGDGRVLSMGGSINPSTNAVIPEIFNPDTNTWTTLPNASLNVNLYPKLHVLPDGRVLLAYSGGPVRTLNVNTGTWTQVGSSITPTAFSSVMYAPGKIMQSGNGTGTSVLDMTVSNPAWRYTTAMSYSRYNHNLVSLPDGKVLAIGGSSDNSNSDASAVYQAEMWNPATETWTQLTPMATPRMYHSIAMLIPDGRVLVAGSGRAGSQTNYTNMEYYSPPYLFKGARPNILQAPTEAAYNSNVSVTTDSTITSAVLISNPSVTHAINMSQRYVPLTFTQNGGQLNIQIPANTNLLPPAYYMLFLLNSNGVPSVAKIIKIDSNVVDPGEPTNTPTNTPTSTLTPTPSFTPTNTPTPPPGGTGFPSTGVLDNFNRANNASIGSSWGGFAGHFRITSNQLDVATNSDSYTIWNTQFGSNQEAYVTFRNPDPNSHETDLILKSQSATTWQNGLILAVYIPSTNRAEVWTMGGGQNWVQRGGSIPVTFGTNDTFGARARSDGYVELYRNGTLISLHDARAWPLATGGGYVGMWVNNSTNTLMDDFGGGNATGSPLPSPTPSYTPSNTPTFTPTFTPTNTPTFTPTFTPTNTPLFTPTHTPTFTPSFTPTFTPTPLPGGSNFPRTGVLDNFNRANSASIGSGWGGFAGHFRITGNQLDVGTTSDSFILWSTRFANNQEAYTTIRAIDLASYETDLILKSQSATTWQNGLILVSYVPSTGVLEIWTFGGGQGWVQRGTTIIAQFQVGDRFGARARADGYVEVYRNEQLLQTADARNWPLATGTGHIGMWVNNATNALFDDFGGGTIP